MFLDNYDAAALGFVLPILAGLLKLPSASVGFLASSVFIGMFFGSLLVSRLSDMIGRKKMLILSVLIFSLAAIGVAFSWDYNSLLAIRILQGFGIGAVIPICIVYVSEISPVKRRAILVALTTVFYQTGATLAGPISNLVIPLLTWRGVFIVGGTTGFILILLTCFTIPESVRQLVKLGKLGEAERVVRRVSSVDPSQMPSKPEITSATASMGKGKLRDLISGKYAVYTSGVCFSALIYGIVFSVLLTMLTMVFVEGGIPYNVSIIFTTVVLSAGILGAFLSGLFIEWFGRRRTMYTSYTLLGTFTLLVSVGLFLKQMYMVVLFGALTFLVIGIAFVSLSTYVTEIYPTNIRNTGHGTFLALVRLGGIIGPTALGILLQMPGYFFVLEGFLLLFVAVVLFFLTKVETRGKSLERITQELSSSPIT